MFSYNLRFFEWEDTEERILINEKQYSQDEFTDLCERLAGKITLNHTKKGEFFNGQDVIRELSEELIKDYGFQYFKVQAGYELGDN